MAGRNAESHFCFSFDSLFPTQYCQPRMTFWHLISFYCYFLWSRENPLQKAPPEPGFYSRPNIRSDDDSVSSLSELHLQGVQKNLLSEFHKKTMSNLSDLIWSYFWWRWTQGQVSYLKFIWSASSCNDEHVWIWCLCDICVAAWFLCLCVVESPSSKWRWDIFEVATLPDDDQIK